MTTVDTSQSTNSVLQSYLNQQAQTIASSTSSSAATSTGNGANTLQGVTGNFNTFLQILTTQLQNQDPTNATDPNQFTQELVQFAGVEQQLNTNSDLQTMINLQKSSGGLSSDLGYIGGYVEAPSTKQLQLQNGTSELAYTLPAGTGSVGINVLNASGQTVAQLTGSTNTGTNYVTWNGQDSSGNQLADGTYTFQLNAAQPNGSAITATNISVIGMVTSVQSNADGTSSLVLGNGGMAVNSSTVTAVFSSTSLPVATTTTSTNSSTNTSS